MEGHRVHVVHLLRPDVLLALSRGAAAQSSASDFSATAASRALAELAEASEWCVQAAELMGLSPAAGKAAVCALLLISSPSCSSNLQVLRRDTQPTRPLRGSRPRCRWGLPGAESCLHASEPRSRALRRLSGRERSRGLPCCWKAARRTAGGRSGVSDGPSLFRHVPWCKLAKLHCAGLHRLFHRS